VFDEQRRRLRSLAGLPDLLPLLRRHIGELIDQTVTRAYHRFGPRTRVPPFDDEPGLALVTVNFSTTGFLKLMLCTLGEQSRLSRLDHLVIVDNQSRDGGLPFLRALAERVPRIHLVERRHLLYQRSRIAAVPSFSAVGVKTTILQAWAMQVPVVAGDPVMRVFGVPGSNSVQGMVDDIAHLLENPDVRRAEGLRARSRIETDHKAPARAAEFAAIVESVLSRNSPPTRNLTR
jgi:glycosyltransferase involved in cell wall biosynthesis